MLSKQKERTGGAIKNKLGSQSRVCLQKSPHSNALQELCYGGVLGPGDGAKGHYPVGMDTHPGQNQVYMPGVLP